MSNILINKPKSFRPDEQEVYRKLKRALSWQEGFGLLFVRCTPLQENLIIKQIKQDITDKKIDVLKLEHSIDNLYDLIDEKVKDNPIDILFISGIEKSLALDNYIKRTLENPKISYQRDSISPLLGHLNWQRERFRDDFNCCLVFTVRKYTLKYLVRRAPDFFDWRSGVIGFPVDREIDLLQYYTPFQRYIEQEKQQEASKEQKDIVYTLEEYFSLLEKLLLLEYENNGDLQFIYSVVKSNTDKLDNFFAQILEQWILATCSELNSEEKETIAGIVESLCIDISQFPLGRWANALEIAITGLETVLQLRPRETISQQWATTLNNLGAVYSKRIFGDKAENLERAIAYYNNALEVRTSEAFPEQWATTLNNLAIAYTQRIRGERRENLETAILCYSEALEIRTCEDFPLDWAKTLNNLGNAYIYRVCGDKGENLEKAIACFDQSLQIYTKESFPEDWATTLNNLANAYRERIRGDRRENLEKAIAYYQTALEVHTRDALPLLWAMTQNNLGNAYRDRIAGDRRENLERAIIAYENALEVHTRDALPLLWAMTQNNLGNAYRDRIAGDRKENLEQAITCYQLALQERRQDNLPLDWAMTQNNLGNAYRDRRENLERAIACYQLALQERRQDNVPLDWAMTQNNLGNAYRDRIAGDRRENLEQAIACYQLALQERRQDNLPLDWAMTQNNLGNAYRDRIAGDRRENLEKAINCYQLALQEWRQDNVPLDCLTTRKNLGKLYFDEENWQQAIESYQIALAIIEDTRLQSLDETRRQEIIAENIMVFVNIVKCFIELKQYDKAIEYVGRSKTRNLVELIPKRELYPKGDIPQEVLAKLDSLRQEILIETRKQFKQTEIKPFNRDFNLEQGMQPTPNLSPLIPDYSYVNQLQKELDQLIEREINPIDPEFQSTQNFTPITFEEIKALIDDNTAIIEWYFISNSGNCPQSPFPAARRPRSPSKHLQKLGLQSEYTRVSEPFWEMSSVMYGFSTGFDITGQEILTFITTKHEQQPLVKRVSSFDEFTKLMSEYLDLYLTNKQNWIIQLPSLLSKFAQILNLEEIITSLKEKYSQIILIPHLSLHLLPLHAFPLTDGKCLLDHFEQVKYAPSCQLLQLIKNRLRQDFTNFFGIQNPTQDLPYTDIEVETISQIFKPHDDILIKEKATKTALQAKPLEKQHYIHFSCHGYFNFNKPLDSALILAGAKVEQNETRSLANQFNDESLPEKTIYSSKSEIIDLEKCLTLGDVFELDLRQCRLVTLSACETGITDINSLSDEYISFPGGFLFAGACNVVATQWTVNDLSTAILMIKFYQLHKIDGLPVAKAMNEAQKWLRDGTQQVFWSWTEQLKNHLKLKQNLIEEIQAYLEDFDPEEQPFNELFYWAAFCAVGK